MSIGAIARNTFKEATRNKIFYLLVVFGIVFALASRLISLLTVGDTVRVLKDTGLAAIHFFCVLIAVFTGINLVYKEIERRTVYNILSKPVSRDQFILGKFVGLALTVFSALAAMALIFFLFVFAAAGSFDWRLLLYFLMLFLELLIIIAISLLFSSFSTPILSFIFTLSLYLIGHVLWTYNEFKSRLLTPVSRWLGQLLYYLLPNLEKFNVRDAMVLGTPISPRLAALTVAYALLYIAALLLLTMAIFRRREFK
jgi:ABC-type transport system involved in multi-copper enzyme maturation permease subunit